MAPIFEDGNNKKDRPREGDLFETRSLVCESIDLHLLFDALSGQEPLSPT